MDANTTNTCTKKIIICWNISLLIALCVDIFIAYIFLNTFSHFSISSSHRILQILQVEQSSFSSSLLSSADDLAKFLHCLEGPDFCFSWGISSLATVPDSIFFSTSSPLSTSSSSWPYFAIINLRMSRSLRHFCCLGKLFLGDSSKFLCKSVGSSYCKKV